MTDEERREICANLRSDNVLPPVCLYAADEIERLAKELAMLREKYNALVKQVEGGLLTS